MNARVCRELWNKVIPGMLDQFDCPSMIRLFAGRPLLILNGDRDPNCPLEGAKIAFAAAEAAFSGSRGERQIENPGRSRYGPQSDHRAATGGTRMADDLAQASLANCRWRWTAAIENLAPIA